MAGPIKAVFIIKEVLDADCLKESERLKKNHAKT